MLYKEKSKRIAFTILVICIIIFIIYNVFMNGNNVIALSKYGSRGQEVRTIQDKLKRWGYYTGNVDGIYGSLTVSAVKRFQQKNGLKVDGVFGKNSWKEWLSI